VARSAPTMFALTAVHRSLAWSECDDEPYYQSYIDEPDDHNDDGEASPRWCNGAVFGAPAELNAGGRPGTSTATDSTRYQLKVTTTLSAAPGVEAIRSASSTLSNGM
jgi:hypothetical protein